MDSLVSASAPAVLAADMIRMPALPPEAALTMPRQSLRHWEGSARDPADRSADRSLARYGARRVVIIGFRRRNDRRGGLRDVSRSIGQRTDVRRACRARAVRRAVRMARVLDLIRLGGFHRSPRRRCTRARHRPLGVVAATVVAHGAAPAHLQRGCPAGDVAPAGDLRVGRGDRAGGRVRLLRLGATPPTRTSGLPKRSLSSPCASGSGEARLFYRRRADNTEAQGRQYRRVGQPLRWPLRTDDRTRRRTV